MSSSTTIAILKLLKLYENRSCADCDVLLQNHAEVMLFSFDGLHLFSRSMLSSIMVHGYVRNVQLSMTLKRKIMSRRLP